MTLFPRRAPILTSTAAARCTLARVRHVERDNQSLHLHADLADVHFIYYQQCRYDLATFP